MEVKLSKAAEARLQELYTTYPDATVGGVFLQINNVDCVVLTTEGRTEWYKLNNLGGIKRTSAQEDSFGHVVLNRRY